MKLLLQNIIQASKNSEMISAKYLRFFSTVSTLFRDFQVSHFPRAVPQQLSRSLIVSDSMVSAEIFEIPSPDFLSISIRSNG